MTEYLIELGALLTRIFVPIIIVIGIVSNLLNIIVLTRPTLIHHACSLYFLALAITNLFYSSVLLVFNLLEDGYQLIAVEQSVILCKLVSYLLNLCPSLSVYFIVFASLDRYYCSSINPQRRRLSNCHVARLTIIILVIVLSIFYTGALVAFDIIQIGVAFCTIRPDVLFNQIFLILVLIIYVIIAPFSMTLFGCLTIYNTKQMRFMAVRISRYRRTEGQLSRMLLLQVGTQILLILPFCTTFFMLILPTNLPSTTGFKFAYVICKIPFYLTVTTAFFLYMLSARVYRDELTRLYKKLFQFRHPIHPIIVTNTTVPTANVTTFNLTDQPKY